MHTVPVGQPNKKVKLSTEESHSAFANSKEMDSKPTSNKVTTYSQPVKKLVIKNLKGIRATHSPITLIQLVAPKLPDNFEDETWVNLKSAIVAIHNKQKTPQSLEELYKVRLAIMLVVIYVVRWLKTCVTTKWPPIYTPSCMLRWKSM